MDEAFRKQAAEWFERGIHDMETAQLLVDQRGHTDAIAVHIQQALEKSLKGYLVLNGKRPPKIHELDTLLNQIMAFDRSFGDFLELCEKVSRYYVDGRYPPGPPISYEYEEMKADLDKAWKLIKTLQARASGKR